MTTAEEFVRRWWNQRPANQNEHDELVIHFDGVQDDDEVTFPDGSKATEVEVFRNQYEWRTVK